jgi:hypothetical protein
MVTKSLCLFLHYRNSTAIPVYIQLFVNELAVHFDEVVIVHTEPDYLKVENINERISFKAFPNEGYDFGLFYNYFSTLDTQQYHQIACINDSNILFNELSPVFNWGNSQRLDFWGLLDSNEKPWFSTHSNNYHIQSHFLIFNKNAILALIDFFSATDIESIFNESDKTKLRRLVINNWEIGLSRYLFDYGLTGKSYINSESFLKKTRLQKPVNLSHKYYKELVESGLPLVKKKVILNSSWFDRFRSKENWELLLENYGNNKWNIDELVAELKYFKKNSSTKSRKIFKKRWQNANKFPVHTQK